MNDAPIKQVLCFITYKKIFSKVYTDTTAENKQTASQNSSDHDSGSTSD